MSSELPDRLVDTGLSALRAGKPFPEVVAEVLAGAGEAVPSPAWEALGALDVPADVTRAAGWLVRQLQERWPPPELSGLRFGLYPVRGPRPGRLELVMALSGGTSYPDPSWLADQSWDPVGYAPTPGLRSLLPDAADASEEARVLVREPLALVYVVGLVAATLDTVDATALLGGRPRFAVAAGFPEGDMVLVGELTAGGLARAMERIVPAPAGQPEAGADGPP